MQRLKRPFAMRREPMVPGATAALGDGCGRRQPARIKHTALAHSRRSLSLGGRRGFGAGGGLRPVEADAAHAVVALLGHVEQRPLRIQRKEEQRVRAVGVWVWLRRRRGRRGRTCRCRCRRRRGCWCGCLRGRCRGRRRGRRRGGGRVRLRWLALRRLGLCCWRLVVSIRYRCLAVLRCGRRCLRHRRVAIAADRSRRRRSSSRVIGGSSGGIGAACPAELRDPGGNVWTRRSVGQDPEA